MNTGTCPNCGTVKGVVFAPTGEPLSCFNCSQLSNATRQAEERIERKDAIDVNNLRSSERLPVKDGIDLGTKLAGVVIGSVALLKSCNPENTGNPAPTSDRLRPLSATIGQTEPRSIDILIIDHRPERLAEVRAAVIQHIETGEGQIRCVEREFALSLAKQGHLGLLIFRCDVVIVALEPLQDMKDPLAMDIIEALRTEALRREVLIRQYRVVQVVIYSSQDNELMQLLDRLRVIDFIKTTKGDWRASIAEKIKMGALHPARWRLRH